MSFYFDPMERFRGQGERMLFKGLPNILPLDNATDPAEDQGASGLDWVIRSTSIVYFFYYPLVMTNVAMV